MVNQLLEESVRRLPPPPSGGSTVAVDGTGLAPGAISTFFVKRAREHGDGLPWRYWLKWLVAVDVPRQVILAQIPKRGPTNDWATLPPLMDAAPPLVPIRWVLADAEFDSERNHQFIRTVLGARSIIPAKRGKPTWRIRGVQARMRRAFPQKRYGQRTLVETVFSVVKRRLSARTPGRSLATQCLQALLLGVAYTCIASNHAFAIACSTPPFTVWPPSP